MMMMMMMMMISASQSKREKILQVRSENKSKRKFNKVDRVEMVSTRFLFTLLKEVESKN